MGHRMTVTKPCYQVSVTSHCAVCNAPPMQSWRFLSATCKLRRYAYARRLLSLKEVPFCTKRKERIANFLLPSKFCANFLYLKFDAIFCSRRNISNDSPHLKDDSLHQQSFQFVNRCICIRKQKDCSCRFAFS